MDQGQRRVAPLQRLVRITPQPQDQGHKLLTTYPGVVPAIEQGMRAMVLGIVEGDAVLQVPVGRGQLSKRQHRGSQRVVGLQEERRNPGVLRQSEELFSQLTCRLQLSTYEIKQPEPPQH